MPVSPKEVYAISVKLGRYVEVDERCMTVVHNDGMQYDLILGQGQGHEPFTVGNPFSNAISSAIYSGSWQLTTDF